MSYPIKLLRTNLKHSGGTKYYVLTLLTAANGNTVLIKRFGPNGKFGQLLPVIYQRVADGQAEFDKILREKTAGRKGYVRDGDDQIEDITDAAGLRSRMGRAVYAKIGANAIKHLDPTINTGNMRDEAPDPEYDEEGNFLGRRPPRVPDVDPAAVEAGERALREQAALEAEQVYSANPNFGLF